MGLHPPPPRDQNRTLATRPRDPLAMSEPGHWGFLNRDVTPDTPPCEECGKEPMIFDDGENFECHRYTCSVTLLRYPMLLLNTGQAPRA